MENVMIMSGVEYDEKVMDEFQMESFREWLTSLDPNESVGTSTLCPINKLFSDLTGEYWSVGYQDIFLCNKENSIRWGKELPAWAKHFVEKIDTIRDLKDDYQNDVNSGWSVVTPKDCLEVLDRVELEL